MSLKIEPPQRRPQNNNTGIFTGFVVGALVAFAGFWFMAYHDPTPRAEGRSVSQRGSLSSRERTTISVFKRVSPSVTFITKYQRSAFSFDMQRRRRGTGSGFVWDKKGHIVTNYHVIRNAGVLKVRLADQSTWSARVVGSAPDKDLAVLKIKAPARRLCPILIGRFFNF